METSGLNETSLKVAKACKLIRTEMAKKRYYFTILTQITYNEAIPIAEPICKEMHLNMDHVLRVLNVKVPKKNSKFRAA